jgi:hypothetical protein
MSGDVFGRLTDTQQRTVLRLFLTRGESISELPLTLPTLLAYCKADEPFLA